MGLSMALLTAFKTEQQMEVFQMVEALAARSKESL